MENSWAHSVNGLKIICIKTGFHPRLYIIPVDNCYFKKSDAINMKYKHDKEVLLTLSLLEATFVVC